MASNYVNTFGIYTVTDAAVTITAPVHAGNRIILNRAAGITATLPAAAGLGTEYVFILAVDATGNQIIQVANATDVMCGTAVLSQDAADAAVSFDAGATSDTITMNGTTTGGLKGAHMILTDIASGLWHVRMHSAASGIEATPFSATV